VLLRLLTLLLLLLLLSWLPCARRLATCCCCRCATSCTLLLLLLLLALLLLLLFWLRAEPLAVHVPELHHHPAGKYAPRNCSQMARHAGAKAHTSAEMLSRSRCAVELAQNAEGKSVGACRNTLLHTCDSPAQHRQAMNLFRMHPHMRMPSRHDIPWL
jgi:hypothetical protein